MKEHVKLISHRQPFKTHRSDIWRTIFCVMRQIDAKKQNLSGCQSSRPKW